MLKKASMQTLLLDENDTCDLLDDETAIIKGEHSLTLHQWGTYHEILIIQITFISLTRNV